MAERGRRRSWGAAWGCDAKFTERLRKISLANSLGVQTVSEPSVLDGRLCISRTLDRADSHGHSPSPKNLSPIDVRAPRGPRVSSRPWRRAPCLFPRLTAVQSPFAGILASLRGDRCSRANRPIHRSPSQRSGCRLLRPGAKPPVHGSSESVRRLNR